MHANEDPAIRAVVDQRIVREVELVSRPAIACSPERDHHGVLGRRGLLDEVADDERNPAREELQLVARPPSDLVGDPVVEDEVFPCAALQQMPRIAVMEVAAAYNELPDPACVQMMALAVARTIAAELRVVNLELDRRVIGDQHPALVVLEQAVAHDQAAGLEPDARAVAMGYPRAQECDILDRQPAPANDEARLALRGGTARD